MTNDNMVEVVRAELLAEAAERAAYDPERAEKLRAAMRRAQERTALPRVAAEPTPIRLWAAHRQAQFGPEQPAAEVARWVRSDFIAVALGGEMPRAETVAQLAALVSDEGRQEELVASIALLTLPIPLDTSDADAVRALLRGADRPADLETLVNAAIALEFAAAHLVAGRHVGRLLAIASPLWWGAGQDGSAYRALQLARHWAPGWSITELMVQVLRHRRRPDWMAR